MKITKPIKWSFTLTSLFILSCNVDKSEKYFEGEIKTVQTQGAYGSLFKVYTAYTISENKIKREQKLGGINSVFDTYAGIIVDLKKDSVILYYFDALNNKKIRHTLSINRYKQELPSILRRQGMPTTFDNTFNMLPEYRITKRVKDSIKIKEFNADYSLYKEKDGVLKQEIFDTKDIKIKRELLQLVFVNIPGDINFPLRSDLKTTASDVNADSIFGDRTRNVWIKRGINAIKKGVDIGLHNTTETTDVVKKIIEEAVWFLSIADFTEIGDLNTFLNSIPENNAHFDD